MTTVFKQAYVGDLQLPYGDFRAINLWFKVMKWWKPDAIDIVGDIDDLLEFSSFSDKTTDEFLKKVEKNPDESIIPFILQVSGPARKFYTDVREAHKDADIFAALGNHEARVFNYVDTKLPHVKAEITPDSLWDLKNLGIPYIHDKFDPPKERHGGAFVMHGRTISTTNALAVAKDIDNFDVSVVRGHSHRGGIYYRPKPLSGRELWGMECGHLCDQNGYGLRYDNNPQWEQGFGINHIVDGVSHPQFIHMKDYTVVIDGKVFSG